MKLLQHTLNFWWAIAKYCSRYWGAGKKKEKEKRYQSIGIGGVKNLAVLHNKQLLYFILPHHFRKTSNINGFILVFYTIK